jgi:hypothetical protein
MLVLLYHVVDDDELEEELDELELIELDELE